MSQIITCFPDYPGEGEALMIPVEVFDSKSAFRFSTAVLLSSVGVSLEEDFVPGNYLVRATLPSSEVLATTVSVTYGDDAKALLKSTRGSQHRQLSSPFAQRHLSSATKDLWPHLDFSMPDSAPRTSFCTRDASGWHVMSADEQKMYFASHRVYRINPGGTLSITIEFDSSDGWRDFPTQVWLQASTALGSVFAPIPPAPKLHVLICAKDKAPNKFPLSILTTNTNPVTDSLLAFLSSGDFQSARTIGSQWSVYAKEMLFHKLEHPMAAAVGGYFLLQAGELKELGAWTENLATWFEWLPDGAIIHAYQLMTLTNPDRDAIRTWLLASVERGIPYYTIGLRLLQNALKLLLHQWAADEEVKRALESINRYLGAADNSSPLTNFTMESPGAPRVFATYSDSEENAPQRSGLRPSDAERVVTPVTFATPNSLCKDIILEGTIDFTGELFFDGLLAGNISSQDGTVIIGENADVAGEIRANRVIVKGKVFGNITVEDRCELHPNSQLIGGLQAGRLIMADGATFVGHCVVTPNKTQLVSFGLREEHARASVTHVLEP